MRLAALSDLHIDRRADLGTWELAKLAFRAASKYDHVIIAGDLFDCSGAQNRDRGAVERELRRLRLWDADRLSIAPGNHDIFPVTSKAEWQTNLAAATKAAAMFLLKYPHAYDDFCEWVGELVPDHDRAYCDNVFPYCRRFDAVTVAVADSTPTTLLQASQGLWTDAEDDGVRDLLADTHGVKFLAMHYPPLATGADLELLGKLEGYVGGFPKDDLERLEAVVDDCGVKAVVCGHIHTDPEAWTWKFGKARAFLMGRTGGCDGATPSIGVLDVSSRGALKWSTRKL